MTPYREGSYTWRYCASMTVDLRGWTSGAADVHCVVPQDWDAFWTGINATDGRDIRITDAEGNLLSFALHKTGGSALDAGAITSRDCTIKIDGSVTPSGGSSFTPTIARMYQVLVWWGQSSVSAPTTGFVSTSTPATGYILTYLPPHRWVGRKERADALTLSSRMHKTTDEQVLVAVDVLELLGRRSSPTGGSYRAVEMRYASYEVQLAGVAQGSMVDASTLRFFGSRFVVFLLKAGTTATSYTISPTIVTTSGETLNPRAQLTVRDLRES